MTTRNRSDATLSPTRMRRRRFLRGFGGAIVGLPFLDALRTAAVLPGTPSAVAPTSNSAPAPASSEEAVTFPLE